MSDNLGLSEGAQAPHLVPSFVETNVAGSQQLATAQIQSRYTIARRFPRNLDVVRQNMLKECKRPSFCMPDMKKNGSSVAIYRVPRGGTNIEGVTIRFAEMAARNFGNIGTDVQQIGEDQTQRIYLVTATDYETNLVNTEIVNVPKTVERKKLKGDEIIISQRTNSYGDSVATIIGTEDDIMMKRNALISKAKRNLFLSFIPGWLIEECVEEIRETARKKDAEDPDASKRAIFDAFATVGVTVAMLNEYIGHPNQLQPAELEELRGYFGAMRDGHTTWAEIAAAKSDDKDGSVSKQIEELLTTSGRTPAVARKLRSSYAGRPQELLAFLQDEAKKKADTGAAQTEQKKVNPSDPTGGTAAKVTDVTPEPPKQANPLASVDRTATHDPAGLPLQHGVDTRPPAQQSKPAPPPVSGEWDSM